MKASLMSVIAAVAMATTVAVPAFAHDSIIPRAGFDSAVAATQTPSGDQGQSAAGNQDVTQVILNAQRQSGTQPSGGLSQAR